MLMMSIRALDVYVVLVQVGKCKGYASDVAFGTLGRMPMCLDFFSSDCCCHYQRMNTVSVVIHIFQQRMIFLGNNNFVCKKNLLFI